MASVWGELKRRNVVKVAVAYAIVGWLLIEVSSVIAPAMNLPDWATSLVVFFVILGFPLALILSWAYEITPEGMKRSHEVEVTESIAHVTGRKIDFAIIGALVLALGFVLVDNYLLEEPPTSSAQTQDRRSIAVLPFDNRSAQAEDQFFVDGMHDDILTQLAHIASIKVISRTSVMGYRDTDKNMRTIGEELNVATILEGGVQRAGETVRINVQLIDAETDEHLWAATYDRELNAENVFAIQSEIATAIAGALQASLSPDDVVRLSDVPTQSTRALNYYLSGNDYYNRPDDRRFKPLAVEMYEQAVAEDPAFALAWAALSRAHSTMYWYAVDPTQSRLMAAEQTVQQALTLTPDLPEAHIALGFYYDVGLRDYDQAQREFTVAARALPDDPYLIELTGYMNRRMGDWREAAAQFERLIERDPRNADLLIQLARTYGTLHEYAEAEYYVDRALDIAPDLGVAYVFKAQIPWFRDGDISLLKEAAENPPMPIGDDRELSGWYAAIYERDYQTALGYLESLETNTISRQTWYAPKSLLYGVTHQLAGQDDLAQPQFQAARGQVEMELASNPEDPRLHIALGQVLTGLGELQSAKSSARRAMELMPRSRDDMSGSWTQANAISGVFAPAGDVEAVVAELEVLLTVSSEWSIEGLLPDPRFDPVRDDPRFQALVERHRRQ